jgi:uncharacterized protein (DUF3084 family)
VAVSEFEERRNAQLNKELTRAKQDRAKLLQDVERLKADCKRLKTNYEHMRENYLQMQRINSELKTHINQLNGELENAKPRRDS